ncbi:hypothetical protein [Tritonibacter mobilis]|uniref:hypothetical protein n=1 Tax=Tritonibacter mobilis TaxID=379347 RepID=UPI001042817E|nr:hypothetical protein [Tritonibacter mobilis]GLP88648.1 hypothetical protein GCM10007921_42110 [Tritonibacter mobilis]
MNRIKPASDPRMPSKIAAITRPIYGEKGDEFLLYLRQFGHITYAANMTGLTRRTFYDRRAKHPDFAEAWDEALAAFEEELTMRVVQTALEMGTGKWVQCFDPETGEPELDDDFEPVYRFETASVDPRVLNKLLSLRMSSVDGPAQTNVQINNSTSVQTSLPAKPRLIQPEGAVRRPVVTETASDERHDTIDAEVVQGMPQETGGASDD